MDAEQESNNHRGSVSSSRSLEIPATPSRSPKKVSFSDELPQSQTPAQQPIQQPAPTVVSHVLQQAAQYLERLHGARDSPEDASAEEVQDNDSGSDSRSSEAAILDLDAVDASICLIFQYIININVFILQISYLNRTPLFIQ